MWPVVTKQSSLYTVLVASGHIQRSVVSHLHAGASAEVDDHRMEYVACITTPTHTECFVGRPHAVYQPSASTNGGASGARSRDYRLFHGPAAKLLPVNAVYRMSSPVYIRDYSAWSTLFSCILPTYSTITTLPPIPSSISVHSRPHQTKLIRDEVRRPPRSSRRRLFHPASLTDATSRNSCQISSDYRTHLQFLCHTPRVPRTQVTGSYSSASPSTTHHPSRSSIAHYRCPSRP